MGEAPVRRGAVAAHTLPDQSVLLFDEGTGTAIPVSESGGRIWQMCDGNHTIDEMVDHLAALYDAERTEIDRDTRGFVEALARHALLETHTPSK